MEGYRNSYEQASRSTIEAATIPVENIDGPVTLVAGAKDSVWNAERWQSVAEQRRKERRLPVEHLVYEKAGHNVVPPYLPVMGTQAYGGSLAGSAYASHDHWPRVLETLSTLE